MSDSAAEALFRVVNESGCDHFEIDSFESSWRVGRDTLCIKCCWEDGQARNVLFKLRFFDVEYLACATCFLDSVFYVGTSRDWDMVRQLVDFSELTGESRLYCVETNRSDWFEDPEAVKQQFKTDRYYILAKSVELEDFRNAR